jgi:hypothetical protein
VDGGAATLRRKYGIDLMRTPEVSRIADHEFLFQLPLAPEWIFFG